MQSSPGTRQKSIRPSSILTISIDICNLAKGLVLLAVSGQPARLLVSDDVQQHMGWFGRKKQPKAEEVATTDRCASPTAARA